VAHGEVEVEPVLPGDDVVVLVLMQPDVGVVLLSCMFYVHQAMILNALVVDFGSLWELCECV
jgi:hypothetical protein